MPTLAGDEAMILRFETFEFDSERRELLRDGVVLALEPKPFSVLDYLLMHRDRAVSKAELLDACWADEFVSDEALTRCIRSIRRAVGDDGMRQQIIKTLRGHGYRFVAEVTTVAGTPDAADAEVEQAPVPEQAPLPQVEPSRSGPTAMPVPAQDATGADLPVKPLPPDAERRQLTMMHVGIVDALCLAEQLDPEDLREVMQRYQVACAEVIERYGGHLAQYLSDGLLVYYGWPRAHEDDARRAAYAGLDIIAVMHVLSRDLEQTYGVSLTMRIGIHTGIVVMEEMDGDVQHGIQATGAVSNLTLAIQNIATPGAIVISAATYAHVRGYFTCRPLGQSTLPGTATALHLYEILQPSAARGRLDVLAPERLTPLVGREAELALLRERWADVLGGRGQVVVLSGDAGIGKSRLVRMIQEQIANVPHTALLFHCSPYHQNTAFFLLMDGLRQFLQEDADTEPDYHIQQIERLAQQAQLDPQDAVPILCAFLSLVPPTDRYPPLQLSPQQHRQRLLDTLTVLVLAFAAQQPVLLIVEDVHWSDPSSLDFLTQLINQGPTAAVLTLMTCRPQFQPPWHARGHMTHLTLSRLTSQQSEHMVQGMLGSEALSTEQRQLIIEKTDGVPLFVEEMTRFVMATAFQLDDSRHTENPASPSLPIIPATLHDSLQARLDQVGHTKRTAQLLATIGREASHSLLQAVSPLPEMSLQDDLQQLVEAELLYQRGVASQATYVFKHALIQEAAYASILRRTRQQYHQQIAETLDRQFPEVVALQPELIAHHYTEANLPAQAVPYWQRAGRQAIEQFAYVEISSHLSKALALLASLPDTPEHARQELTLRTMLGPTLIVTRGHASPEVERNYSRAQALCEQVGEARERYLVLLGLQRNYFSRGNFHQARQAGEQLLILAERLAEPAYLLEAHDVLGFTLLYMGELAASRHHLERCVTIYDPQQHLADPTLFPRDSAVTTRTKLAHLLWTLGYPDQALQWARQGVALAHDLAHPFSLAVALLNLAELDLFLRDPQTAREHVQASIELCTELGMAMWLARGEIILGWTMVEQGQVKQCIAQIHSGFKALHATGATDRQSHYRLLLAEAYRYAGALEKGLHILDESLIDVEHTGEHLWEAELYRCKGELLRQTSDGGQDAELPPEACFQHALAIARHQQARIFELRAAVSLGRLWQCQDKQAAALLLLKGVFDTFTEGFDSVDLQEAKALIAELT